MSQEKKSVHRFNYSIDGHCLALVKQCKYLGVTLCSDLRWNTHIDNVVRKASGKLWYLKRNLKQASWETKLKAYKTCVRPVLEYACEVWDPHTAANIVKLESVQRKALRFIFNKYRRLDSVSDLYRRGGLETLEFRRKKSRLKLLYLFSRQKLSQRRAIHATHSSPMYSPVALTPI